jgi:hypothetical protein
LYSTYVGERVVLIGMKGKTICFENNGKEQWERTMLCIDMGNNGERSGNTMERRK